MAPMGTCAGAWYFHRRILRRRLGFVCRGLGTFISAYSMLGFELVNCSRQSAQPNGEGCEPLDRKRYTDDRSFSVSVADSALGLSPPLPQNQRLYSLP